MSSNASRCIVYVDGFNLYYGAIKGGPHKWLDLQKYCRLLRPHDDIQAIRYFTALVVGSHRADQEIYLKTLETLPLLQVVLGKYKTKQLKCQLAACTFPGTRIFSTQEEKRTDVNIAINMVHDAYQGSCDKMVLISGDSDLVPAVSMVKHNFPNIEISVYVPARDPTRGAAVELRMIAHKNKTLPINFLAHAQFPSVVNDGAGGTIHKPASW